MDIAPRKTWLDIQQGLEADLRTQYAHFVQLMAWETTPAGSPRQGPAPPAPHTPYTTTVNAAAAMAGVSYAKLLHDVKAYIKRFEYAQPVATLVQERRWHTLATMLFHDLEYVHRGSEGSESARVHAAILRYSERFYVDMWEVRGIRVPGARCRRMERVLFEPTAYVRNRGGRTGYWAKVEGVRLFVECLPRTDPEYEGHMESYMDRLCEEDEERCMGTKCGVRREEQGTNLDR